MESMELHPSCHNQFSSSCNSNVIKIIDCKTGNCLKVLVGYIRTPWVVRFHPLQRQILATGNKSGSELIPSTRKRRKK
jgi:hypothetical protein